MDLKPETPAEGILKRNDWGDSRLYQVPCECHQPDHEHNVWVEASETGVEVQVYVTAKTNFWSKTRWHHVWQLLTKGYVRCETTLGMTPQQAMNYATMLHHAVEDVEQFRKAKK